MCYITMKSLYVACVIGHVGAVTALLEGKTDVASIDKVHGRRGKDVCLDC